MEDNNNKVDCRCQNIQGVEEDTVLKIQRMLHNNNHHINTLKIALNRITGEFYKLAMNPNRRPSGQHERRYNEPLINEVTTMVFGKQYASNYIFLYACDGVLTNVPDQHTFYDASQYSLIISKG